MASRLPGLVLRDHVFSPPLDHDDPGGECISLYAREVVAPGREDAALPWLCFLQGGPGGKAPRPAQRSGWLARALEDYRVLLLDQRGTGRSTPATRQTLPARGDAEAQARYLRHFRADAIVRDAEHVRRRLAGEQERWSVLGQSYGGFCVVRYLSAAPEGLREAFVTGGLPSLERPVDDVYRATYARVLASNEEHERRYPGDRRRAAEVAEHLLAHDVRLPSGDPLTAERFQALGLALGARDGFERLHYLLEEAWLPAGAGREISEGFLWAAEAELTFAANPLYAVMHESIYCQEEASRWSAQRLRDELPQLDPRARPFCFTGEMIYPWMFELDAALRPLRPVAELLAAEAGWPRLYDLERLRRNEVPCAAVVYHGDMYVPAELSLETAARIGRLRLWVTNEHEHDGLRQSGERVLGRLIELARGDA